MNQTINVGYGKANLKNTLVTYASMLVSAPFKRVSASTSGKPAGQRVVTRVGSHEDNGVLVVAPVEHVNGAIILLQTKWLQNGAVVCDGSLFLRLRAQAPCYNVMALLPAGHDNLAGPKFSMFQGNADLLRSEELPILGLDVHRSYIKQNMEPDELAECYEILMIRPESQPRPTVAAVSTPTGIEMREIAQAPLRRLRPRARG